MAVILAILVAAGRRPNCAGRAGGAAIARKRGRITVGSPAIVQELAPFLADLAREGAAPKTLQSYRTDLLHFVGWFAERYAFNPWLTRCLGGARGWGDCAGRRCRRR